MSFNPFPFVSVIVPVFNGGVGISKTIETLIVQSYPREHFEIIVVDNGSEDQTRIIIKNFPVILLEQPLRGSYAARNIGIAHAKGDILAFTDSDCIPDKNWISNGVNFMQSHNAKAIGGFVTFIFSNIPSPAEYTDALISIDNENSIIAHGMAATANLFVKKETLQHIGIFNQKLQSGGDGEWSARAKKSGITMMFAKDAVVYHPARNFNELIKKHIRIGSGSMEVWSARGKNTLWKFAATIHLFTPIFAFKIPALVRKKLPQNKIYPIGRMMCIAYLCKIATGFGIIKSLLGSK